MRRMVVHGKLFRGNCPEEKSPGIIVLGGISEEAILRWGQLARGECPDAINHNAVFFNSYMSYLAL